MARKKFYGYVLVFTETKPVFVTGINYIKKVAEWDNTKVPLEVDCATGRDLCYGLMLNGYHAVYVTSLALLGGQPYMDEEDEEE